MSNLFKSLRKQVISGYSVFDITFLSTMMIVQIVVFVINPASVLGVIGGISGVLSVVLCAKGNISSYFVSFIQIISCTIIAFQNAFYGEVVEHIIAFGVSIVGICMWRKRLTTDNGVKRIKSSKLSIKNWIVLALVFSASTLCVFLTMGYLNSAEPFSNAMILVLNLLAQFLMLKCYKEQWLLWVLLDIVFLRMYIGTENWSMIAMYSAWIVNCIYGWVNWSKLGNNIGSVSSVAVPE